jgi:hypothetical protein
VPIVLVDVVEEAARARVVVRRPTQQSFAGRIRPAPRAVDLQDRHDVRRVLEQRDDVGPVIVSGHVRSALRPAVPVPAPAPRVRLQRSRPHGRIP